MDKRPLTQSMRQWLLDELAHWQSLGLVSEDQANAIVDQYETPKQASSRHQSTAIYVLIGVAAMFVALSLFFCIGLSWNHLPDPIKLICILGAVCSSHALGFYLRYGMQANAFSEFAFFFGSLLYGAAIALIANVFDMHSHAADGIWWWALGVAPLALFLDTVLCHLLLTTLLAVWVGWELLGHPGHEHVFPCVTLPLFAALGIGWAYQKKSLTTIGLYVPLLAWWLVLIPFAFNWRENPIFFIGSVGAFLLILAEVHPEGSRFGIPYRFYGALLCMGVLSVLSFREIHHDVARIHQVVPFVVHSILITMFSIGAFAIAFVVQSQRGASYERPLFAFAVRQWLPLSMAALMLLMALYYVAVRGMIDQRGDWFVFLLPMALSNIAMLVLAFWLMMYGLREDRGFPSAGGVIFFLLWSIFRYAEWFGDRGGMFGAACMFFTCGAAIFAFAMYWHFRKKDRERREHERTQ